MSQRSLLTLILVGLPVWGQAQVAKTDVHVPMRDGVRLSANIFLPEEKGRFPAILIRTPYGKGSLLAATYKIFLDNGYAVVVEDVRGRGSSEGTYRSIEQESSDGEDTLEWIAAQPWSDGRTGMVGGSYLGITQWRAAITGNPHLVAISPAVSGCDEYEDRYYSRGGAFRLGHRLMWLADNLRAPGFKGPPFAEYVKHLPLRTADLAAAGRRIDFFQAALDHPAYDSYWKALSTREQLHRVHAAVLVFGGWYDPFVANDLEAFRRLRALGRPVRIIVGPWTHDFSSRSGIVDFGPAAAVDVRRLQLEWFDRWIKGKRQPDEQPAARVFMMGANHWRELDAWPPPEVRKKVFYLASGGKLSESPPRESKPDRFVYDPANPAPTVGGQLCCNPMIWPWGPADQRAVEARRDVLVYSTEPLAREISVLGPVEAELFVSTSAPDTDFTAKLVDVYPDGRAVNLTDGILRLRYRDSLERPAGAKPGTVYEIRIEVGPTGNVFRRGHRIRLEISSSNFPRFDRNPNTGRAVAGETRLQKARQAVYHDPRRGSRLVLPVIEEGRSSAGSDANRLKSKAVNNSILTSRPKG